MQTVRKVGNGLPTGCDVYMVVKSAWHKSMELVERLLEGVPQNLRGSEPLLGLASWHLYPDMTVLGAVPSDIRQEDDLFIPGGILTLGMTPRDSLLVDGISWSLPLSHLRFYGKPVISTRSLGLDSERIRFDEMQYFILGAVTGNWFAKTGGIAKVVDFLESLFQILHNSIETTDEIPDWLHMLCKASQNFAGRRGEAKEDAERLFKLGHRRGARFLSSTMLQIPEAFGLSDFTTYITSLVEPEERIERVRDMLPKSTSNVELLQDGFISYHPGFQQLQRSIPSTADRENEHNHSSHPDASASADLESSMTEEFATIQPISVSDEGAKQHQRRVPSNHLDETDLIRDPWYVPGMVSPQTASVKRCSDLETEMNEVCRLYHHPLHSKPPENPDSIAKSQSTAAGNRIRRLLPPFTESPIQILNTSSPAWSTVVGEIRVPPLHTSRHRPSKAPAKSPFMLSPFHTLRRRSPNAPTNTPVMSYNTVEIPETNSRLHPVPPVPFCMSLRDAADRDTEVPENMGCPSKYYYCQQSVARQSTREYKLFFGTPGNFGVWFPIESACGDLKVDANQLLRDLRRTNTLSVAKALSEHLDKLWRSDLQEHLASLKAFVFASTVFSGFPDASIALSIIKNPLSEPRWSQQRDLSFCLGRSFSCLAMFETGVLDIDPIELNNIMAMSAANSLFMAEFLFSDPSEVPDDHVIRRTIGNIGRPGVSFLISTKNPDVREADFASWKSVSYSDFDGKLENNFLHTSMHLSLTGDEQPLNIGQTGYRDKEVFLIECVIRVYDRSRWVADLDIVSSYKNQKAQSFIERQRECEHSEEQRSNYSLIDPLTSIDSWDELLDLPRNACVVRANGNWLARQAVCCCVLQKLKPVVLASGAVCWSCVENSRFDTANLLIVS